MRARTAATTAATVLAALLVAACGGDPSPSADEPEPDPRTERLEQLAGQDPADVVSQVSRALDGAEAVVEVDPGDGAPAYTLVVGPDAWRVDGPAGDGAGDGTASVLAVGRELCVDREFRPVLSGLVSASYGFVAFDPQPWSCTPAGFGLNQAATFSYSRHDPRGRLDTLTTDDPAAFTAEVEEVEGEPLLHVRTTGATEEGLLDPARPAYDLWVDADRRPVRMTTAGESWDLTYPDGLAEVLAAPPPAERGSYGFAVGPGQGVAKACFQSGLCDDADAPGNNLTWGDGRPS